MLGGRAGDDREGMDAAPHLVGEGLVHHAVALHAPDALERRHGLAPEVVQAVEATIDETLASAASSLEMFVQSPKEPSP